MRLVVCLLGLLLLLAHDVSCQSNETAANATLVGEDMTMMTEEPSDQEMLESQMPSETDAPTMEEVS